MGREGTVVDGANARIRERQAAFESRRLQDMKICREKKALQRFLQLPSGPRYVPGCTNTLVHNPVDDDGHVSRAMLLMKKLANTKVFSVDECTKLKKLLLRRDEHMMATYATYLKRHRLKQFVKSSKQILINLSTENSAKSKNENETHGSERLSRADVLETYIKAVDKQNKSMIQTYRGMLLTRPSKPSYDRVIGDRLKNLIKSEENKTQSNIPPVPKVVMDNALIQIENLDFSSVERSTSDMADWAIKVGVEAQLLKSQKNRIKGKLWDWRGRIEHDTIELQPHDCYVDYIQGKKSEFWLKAQ